MTKIYYEISNQEKIIGKNRTFFFNKEPHDPLTPPEKREWINHHDQIWNYDRYKQNLVAQFLKNAAIAVFAAVIFTIPLAEFIADNDPSARRDFGNFFAACLL